MISKLGIINQCRLVKHISDYSRTAPVRCFHLTATVLSGEKHLTSAIIEVTALQEVKPHASNET